MPTPFPRTSPRRPVQIVTPRTAGEAAFMAWRYRTVGVNRMTWANVGADHRGAWEAAASAAIAFCAAPSAAAETREGAK